MYVDQSIIYRQSVHREMLILLDYRSSRSQSSQRRNNTYGKRRPVQNSFKSIRSRCAQVGIHQKDPEAGMYVRALVHSVNTNLLVDTGATLSVL